MEVRGEGRSVFRGLLTHHAPFLNHRTELIDTYLNGPRTLSVTRLSYLTISHTPSSEPYPSPPQTPTASVDMAVMLSQPAEEDLHDFSLFLAAVHSIGDGMALHAFANDFFCLLGSSNSAQELHGLLSAEWEKRWAGPLSDRVCFNFTSSFFASDFMSSLAHSTASEL